MRILAIDPGPEQSAWLVWDGNAIGSMGIYPNTELLKYIERAAPGKDVFCGVLAIEMVACYGMPVGAEVFETCVWIGRFIEAFGSGVYVYRRDVKLHLCNSARAKDPNIRQALIDRFGGKAKAIGNKATPGPLYGIKSHLWAALAVAVYATDMGVRP